MAYLSICVAATANRVIGKDNTMPWHLPEDLKQFRLRTQGHTVIMGRKTYESIGKPLPKRRNIIISRAMTTAPEGTELYSGIEAALEAVTEEEEAFIIGGAEIYRQTIDKADKIYLTRVEEEFQGDTYFPEFSKKEWTLTETAPSSGFTLEIWEKKN